MESCPKSRERAKISKFLGGGFKYCVIFIPIYLGKIPHVDSYFSDGLVQPPTNFWVLSCYYQLRQAWRPVEVLACFGSCWRVQSRCFGTPPLRRAAIDMTPKKPPENLRVFWKLTCFHLPTINFQWGGSFPRVTFLSSPWWGLRDKTFIQNICVLGPRNVRTSRYSLQVATLASWVTWAAWFLVMLEAF